MASAEEPVGSPKIDEGYTHAEDVLADGEPVAPESADPVPTPDPVPVTSNEIKEGDEEGKTEGGKDKMKSMILISGAAVAVIGAIFAIAKKIKQA